MLVVQATPLAVRLLNERKRVAWDPDLAASLRLSDLKSLYIPHLDTNVYLAMSAAALVLFAALLALALRRDEPPGAAPRRGRAPDGSLLARGPSRP